MTRQLVRARRPARPRPAPGPRLRLTLRARLSVVLGGAFLAAGGVLVLVLYLLMRNRLAPSNRVFVAGSTMLSGAPSAGPTATVVAGDVEPLPAEVQGLARSFEQQVGAYDARTLQSLLQWSAVAVVVLLVAAVAIGWLLVGRTLRPLQEITATARRATDRSLHERIGLTGPQDELKELADTFDAMLERLDQSFAGQRRFVANASHELRTPLAINRTVLEVALDAPQVPPELQQVGRTLLATNERSERLIDGLLALASSDREPAVRLPLDLADVARQALDLAAAEARERRVEVTADLRPGPVGGDGVLLERLVLNLVQNGVRHNVPGGRLDVRTAATGAGTELVVANTGPTVPPYEVEGLFEPFRRLGGQRTGSDRGVGLGLSIVRAAARAHGGSVTATPRPEGGLSVRVLLPPVTDQPPAAAVQGPAAVRAR